MGVFLSEEPTRKLSTQKTLEIEKILNSSSEELLSEANKFFDSQEFTKSKLYFAEYLKKNPEDNKARTDLALAHLQTGNKAKAIQMLKNILGKKNDFFPARLSLALHMLLVVKKI